MRNRFDKQLEQLNIELITMGALCEEAINNAIDALWTEEETYVEKVHTTEDNINHQERAIEAMCMKLLLHQQPVARDLRTISSALKMISDMERIGDQAEDIADITMHLRGANIKQSTHLKDMTAAAVKMVNQSIEAFVQKDLGLAYQVMQYDDVVDDLFNRIKEELIDLIRQDPANGAYCIDLLMIIKYLERIGDHAVNIAEWVEYSITGTHNNC